MNDVYVVLNPDKTLAPEPNSFVTERAAYARCLADPELTVAPVSWQEADRLAEELQDILHPREPEYCPHCGQSVD